jgi:hypothetical protein
MFAQLLSSTPRFDIMANSKQTFYWRTKNLGIAHKINYKTSLQVLKNTSSQFPKTPKI